MWKAALLLVLGIPAAVYDLEGYRDWDGTVRLYWMLPGDPSIIGIRIVRERLDGHGEDVFEILGLPSTFHDTTASPYGSYRYGVMTLDWDGHQSHGKYVDLWSEDEDDTYWDDVLLWCLCTSSPASSSSTALALAALLGALSLVPRRYFLGSVT